MDSRSLSGERQKLRRFIRHHGYHDVFLIDPAGNLVYTAFKELDFATNLKTGPWKETGLAHVFRAALELDEPGRVAFEDFKSYEPSAGDAAAFLASPVNDEQGKLVGVLAFQIPIDRFNGIMHVQEGMGRTGETYLVQRTGKMLTQSRFFEKSTVLSMPVETPTAKIALAKGRGVEIVLDYRGIPVISAHSPLTFEGVTWAVMAEIDKSEALEGDFARAAVLGVLGLLVGLGVAMTINALKSWRIRIAALEAGDRVLRG